jgi:exodeoxyribonuclease VII small subunit
MTDIATMGYEAAFAELETIVEQLATGDLALEETVALYSRGRALAAHCQALLDSAELRISRLDDASAGDLVG